ncbi:proto-oncogene tyrosine-protein kinase receptor Ret-like [Gigantopelta aegis]|uniref:proto-oncogene tyrosine-protein kinase receptor Ret-like n=1 Tax=Gigantopelta aegis TaxID=1735272 RepID=UPI001B88A4E3|nr:proto-oncogene tyrosine-protein kinase receptor Ret-like [Gigantopelta aegis]
MSPFFQTCTPAMDTCVDGACDDVERLNKFICPQDCTKVGPRGEWLKNSLTGQGIAQAKGTCWCDHNAICTCASDYQNVTTTTHTPLQGYRQLTERVTKADITEMVEMKIEKLESCNKICKIVVASSVAGLLIMALVGFSLCWQRRHRQRRSQGLKDVTSIIYMTSLPSDYAEDRERRPSNISHQCSPSKNDVGDLDAKWEFPRQHLVLEETLGEGEFGQVVKARAWGLEGDEKWSQVAVKMLKPDATGSEFQDLWSELNLLKEVNHPNVIRLLGACTQSGPFYVIVEFCQFGCLKSYLRSARFNGRPSWDERQDASGCNRKRNPITLSLSHLLSFAWQIAKGMEYISIMKLIHRDLAARNILVAEDNLVKISDFGLSRDVYEADTYLKMSKGRIPVKWMAPESLYAQIYTTKSDIWSFGIVLWEITTLGANPYPGIVPERLFSLLKTGYRMDRPDDCTEEMYAVMQKCWKTAPEQRPSFTLLANILDSMLQQHREYLELSNEVTYTETVSCNEEDRNDLDDVENGYGSISRISPTPSHLTEIPESPEDNELSDCEEYDAFLPKPDQSSAAPKNTPSALKTWGLHVSAAGNMST